MRKNKKVRSIEMFAFVLLHAKIGYEVMSKEKMYNEKVHFI